MSRILHIAVSPRGDRSKSLQVTRAFLDEYMKRAPGDEITQLDVFQMDLPSFDGPLVQVKYNILQGQDSSEDELRAWNRVEDVIADFKAADKYLLSVPMWNFGIPYRLKQYFDVLVQPGYTFSFDPEKGYSGLVTGKPAVVILARGGDYAGPEASRLDFQKPYIETILGFIGIADIRSIVIEPTLAGGPDLAEARLQEAIAGARVLAKSF